MLCGQGWVLALGRGRRRARGGGRGGPSLRASACPGRGACAAPPEAVAAGRSEAGVGAAQSTGRAPRAVTVLAAGSSGGASRLRRRGSFPGVAGSVRAVRSTPWTPPAAPAESRLSPSAQAAAGRDPGVRSSAFGAGPAGGSRRPVLQGPAAFPPSGENEVLSPSRRHRHRIAPKVPPSRGVTLGLETSHGIVEGARPSVRGTAAAPTRTGSRGFSGVPRPGRLTADGRPCMSRARLSGSLRRESTVGV